MTITLRDYQQAAVAAVEDAWMRGVNRPGVVMATGLGKTFPAAALAVRARAAGRKTIFLVHDAQLVRQFAASVERLDPDGQRVGIVVAQRHDPTPHIVAATFQTMRTQRRRDAVGPRDLVITDECHHAPAATFHEVLDWFGAAAGGSTRAVGFTATMTRADGKVLGDLWEEVVYTRDIRWAIENGFLVPPSGLTVSVDELNGLADIATVHGDYKTKELSALVARAADATVEAICTHAHDAMMIVFAADIEHATHIAEMLTARGIPAAPISGKTPTAQRKTLLADFSARRLRALVNVQVLTEGVDLPLCDAVVLARPTRSASLYAQMVGRALRQYTDPVTGRVKDTALILDLVGAVRDNSLVTLTDLYPAASTKRVRAAEPDIDLGPLPPREPVEKVREYADGVPELVDIDLFGKASPLLWLTTSDGVVFTPLRDAKDSHVFLWPPNPRADQEVAIGRITPNSVEFLLDENGVPQTGLPGDARDRVYSDDLLPPEHRTGVKASWRRRTEAPTRQQLDLAVRMGIDVEGHTKGTLSDALTTVIATRTFRRSMQRISTTYTALT